MGCISGVFANMLEVLWQFWFESNCFPRLLFAQCLKSKKKKKMEVYGNPDSDKKGLYKEAPPCVTD